MITKIYPKNPDYKVLQNLIHAIEDGALVIYPTGIGYALGCNALKQNAVEELYRLKQSNIKKQRFAIMCPSIASAAQYARIDNQAFNYIKTHEHEAITYLLPSLSSLPKILKKSGEIGIRLSLHAVTTLILENLNAPLITASLPIRKNEKEYLTNPELINEEYGNSVYTVIDGGLAEGSVSAIINLQTSGPTVIRTSAPLQL